MSYTPHTWQSGETVTAEKLNALEQGVGSGGGVFAINMVYDEVNDVLSLDKTFYEIKTALENHVLPIVFYVENIEGQYGEVVGHVYQTGKVEQVGYNAGDGVSVPKYYLAFKLEDEWMLFISNDPSDYPIFSNG